MSAEVTNQITLYIAEKPSMARDIARVLGANKRDGIKWVGDGVWVSWCIGHLVEIATPDAHDPRWKSWRPEVLPVLPPVIQWEPKPKTRGHLKQLRALINNRGVTRLVNACDAGREGELIFRTVYAHARCAKPVWRFWVSSLTREAIRRGVNTLRPSVEFDPLGAAAYCRAEADWLVGMNATRALTARATDLLSLGRVQTPTLAMVVERQAEIDEFVPEDYWVIEATLESKSGAEWSARWSRTLTANEPPLRAPSSGGGKLKRPEEATAIIERCRGQVGEVLRAEGKEQRIPPPLLFHLTALQQEANRRFGFTADRTLTLAQALYEKHKVISYPRTDSRHLTPDVARSLPSTLRALTDPWSAHATPLLNAGLTQLSTRYVNAQKVTDHHAIIPTDKGADVQKLDRDELRIYDLIARSLLAALSPPAVDQQMTLEAGIGEELWVAQGRVELDRGWREVAPAPIRPPQERSLPYVAPGTPTRARSMESERRQTQPPKPFTDATLLGAMEHAGRRIEESELRAVMRESGLGTPATRANILGTLLRRGYLSRDRKTLIPTDAGKILVRSVNEPALLVPELTANWERQLNAIANGDEDPRRFSREVRGWIQGLVTRLSQGERIVVPESVRSRKRGKGRGASRQSSSRQSSSRQSSSRQSSSRQSASRQGASRQGAHQQSWASSPQPAQGSEQSHQKRAKSHVNTTSASSGSSHAARTTTLPLDQLIGRACPRCRQGAMIKGRRGWGCDRWREGCTFVIWFEHEGVPIPEAEAARLCARGKTRLFHQQDGRKHRLILKERDELCWESSSSAPRGAAKRSRGAAPSARSGGWRSKARKSPASGSNGAPNQESGRRSGDSSGESSSDGSSYRSGQVTSRGVKSSGERPWRSSS